MGIRKAILILLCAFYVPCEAQYIINDRFLNLQGDTVKLGPDLEKVILVHYNAFKACQSCFDQLHMLFDDNMPQVPVIMVSSNRYNISTKKQFIEIFKNKFKNPFAYLFQLNEDTVIKNFPSLTFIWKNESYYFPYEKIFIETSYQPDFLLFIEEFKQVE